MQVHSEEQRQKQNAVMIRNRLMSGIPSSAKDIEHMPAALAEIRRLSFDLAKASAEIEARDKRIATLKKERERLKLDLASAKNVILSYESSARLLVHNGQEIEEIVAPILKNYGNVTWEEILDVKRGGSTVTQCRQDCMLAVKEGRRDLSLPTIARIFNRKCHSSVIDAVKIAAQRRKDKQRAAVANQAE